MSVAAIGTDAKQVNDLAAVISPSQQRVLGAIQRASAKTGVDFAYLVKKAETESSFNPTAQAKGSSARGLYQFVNATWLDTLDKHAAEVGRSDLSDAITRKADGSLTVADPAKRKEIMALRDDPELSATMAAELASDNAATIKAKLKTENVTGTDLYLAHFLGAGGASSLLSKLKDCPNAPACNVVPEAAAANRSVFYTDGGRARSVKEVYAHFADKFGDSKVETAGAAASSFDKATTADNTDAVAAAQQMAMATLQQPSLSGFGSSFAGTDEGIAGTGLTMSGTAGVTSASYTMGSGSSSFGSMTAGAKAYSARSSVSPQMLDNHSIFYAMMLADQKQKTRGL